MNEWQPMETAPKDRDILGWVRYARSTDQGYHLIVNWEGDAWVCADRIRQRDVTHWMPLPSPPEGFHE